MKLKVSMIVTYEFEVDKFYYSDDASDNEIMNSEFNFFYNSPEELLDLVLAENLQPVISIEKIKE